jgi:hypothetical protein
MNINNGTKTSLDLQKDHCGEYEFRDEEIKSAFMKVDNIMDDLKIIISQINIINKLKKKNHVS